MDKLVDNLYNLSLSLDSSARSLYETERQDAAKLFHSLMDKVDAAFGIEFHEKLYDAVMEYLAAEQYRAFYLGLRLGLQLHTL